jgi:hypothetical protein
VFGAGGQQSADVVRGQRPVRRHERACTRLASPEPHPFGGDSSRLRLEFEEEAHAERLEPFWSSWPR